MNVTYYLGAGASANSVPVLNKIFDRLILFRNYVHEVITDTKEFEDAKVRTVNSLKPSKCILNQDAVNYAEQLIADIDSLLGELEKHQTLDTLAKKLFLTPGRFSELIRLKNVISVFFLFEQIVNVKEMTKASGIKKPKFPDKRYDTFIASLVGSKPGKIVLPHNIKIITWNYDLQFELSIREYLNGRKIAEIQRDIHSIPCYTMLHEGEPFFDTKVFSIVHLNGIIGLAPLNNIGELFKDTYADDLLADPSLNMLCKIYGKLSKADNENALNKSVSFFNYYWEYQELFKENVYNNYQRTHELAQKIMEKTNILVVVGYTFPVFNRDLDAKLLKSLPDNCKKIYVQDPEPDAIVDRIVGVSPDRFSKDMFNPNYTLVIPIEDKTQFYLPAELSFSTVFYQPNSFHLVSVTSAKF